MQLSIVVSTLLLAAKSAANAIRDEVRPVSMQFSANKQRSLEVRHCDCITPKGPCGCNASRKQVKVLGRDLRSVDTFEKSIPPYIPAMPGPPPGIRQPAHVHCLCIIENVDGTARPCPCAVDKREETAAFHCMCIIDLPNGTYKPCGCNSDVSFLGNIQHKPIDLTAVNRN